MNDQTYFNLRHPAFEFGSKITGMNMNLQRRQLKGEINLRREA